MTAPGEVSAARRLLVDELVAERFGPIQRPPPRPVVVTVRPLRGLDSWEEVAERRRILLEALDGHAGAA